MTAPEKFRYRPEIDGLRALAVLAVVFYHGGFSFPGGFVGVDVFFVISGFLITSILWRDLEAGRFSFANFWERRARRIVPALVVVTAATLIVGWFLLSPLDYADLGRAVTKQTFFTANIHYWKHTGYFAGASEEKPLLHVWSLAVEEQFYLIVPFLFWGLFSLRKFGSRAVVLAVLGMGFALSLAVSVRAVSHAPMAAFYLLQSRAWELLLGSIIALLPAVPVLKNNRVLREGAGLAALALLILPLFLYSSATPFPGLTALPPCLGAALLILSSGQGQTLAGRLLSLRPLVFVGLISYSLYLWHWPLLAFAKYYELTTPVAPVRAGLLALGFICAVLSWKFVETPFRTRKVGITRKAMFAWAGVSLLVLFVFGHLCRASRGFPKRLSPAIQKSLEAKNDQAFVNELSLEDVRAGRFVSIGKAGENSQPAVFVWGDSHAMSAMPAFDALLKERGLSGRAATRSITAPVVGWPSASSVKNREKRDYNDTVFEYIKQQKIADVFLVGSWSAYTGKEKDEAGKPLIDSALLDTVKQLVAIGSRPWVVLDVPIHPYDVPRALARASLSDSSPARFCARPPLENELSENDRAIIAALKAAGAQVLDPKPRFLDESGGYYKIELGGVPLYRDTDHLTVKGANLVLLPFLREAWTRENRGDENGS